MAPKKILTLGEVRKKLREYKKRLRKVGVQVGALYLFGSYAKKNPRPWSDIDVAVVSDMLGKDFVRESVLLNRVADEVHPFIQAHPFHPRDLRDKFSTVAAEIRRHGRKV